MHPSVKGFIVLSSLTFNGPWPSQLFPLKRFAFSFFRRRCRDFHNCSDPQSYYTTIIKLHLSAGGVPCCVSWPSKLEPSGRYAFPFQKFLAKPSELPDETKEKAWQWVCFQPLLLPQTSRSLCLVLSPKTIRGFDRVPTGVYPRNIAFGFSSLECLHFLE